MPLLLGSVEAFCRKVHLPASSSSTWYSHKVHRWYLGTQYLVPTVPGTGPAPPFHSHKLQIAEQLYSYLVQVGNKCMLHLANIDLNVKYLLK